MLKYRLHWSIHPEKDEAWYAHESNRMSPDEVARELDINYSLSVSGKVFSSFNEAKHVDQHTSSFNPALPVYRVWDFGKTNCVLYAQIDRYGRKRILRERLLGVKALGLNEADSNIMDQAHVCMQDSKEWFPGAEFIDICDPAGSYEDQRGATTEIKYLEDAPYNLYMNYQHIKELSTRDRKKRAISQIMVDMQNAPQGKEAFQIYCSPNNDEGCPILKKALQGGYCYKKDTNGNILDKIEEKHPYEDVIDCLVYLYIESDALSGGHYYGSVEPVVNTGYIDPYVGF